MKPKICYQDRHRRICYYETVTRLANMFVLEYRCIYRHWLFRTLKEKWVTATYQFESNKIEHYKTYLFWLRKAEIKARNEKRYNRRYPCERL